MWPLLFDIRPYSAINLAKEKVISHFRRLEVSFPERTKDLQIYSKNGLILESWETCSIYFKDYSSLN